MATRTQTSADYRKLTDAELARLCATRDRHAIEHVITANNQRLFRTAWSILKHRAEAEEAVQAAYLSAFANMRVRRAVVALNLAHPHSGQ